MLRKLLSGIILSVLALSVSGCVPQSNASALTTDEFYSQKLVTKKCGEFLCGTIKAPLSWDDLSKGTIKLSFTYKPVAGSKKFLFVNPGGPGASGVQFVTENPDYIGTAALRDAYNIVGFDPRGTNGSSPVKCLNDKDMDSFLYEDTGYRAGSEKDLQVIRAAIKEYVSACQNNSGEILGNIDTVQAAKDLDLFRAVFGQKTLDYLGYSYGTFLGTTYAALFPTKVGRFVLDGAIDPSVSDEDASLNQLIGFDNALKAYMKECLNGLDCPFSGTVEDGLGQLSDYLDQIESAPINSQDGRTVGVGVMLTGLYMTLYSDEYWGYLTQAFNEAIQNEDGTVFIQLADYYNDRKEGGSYASNQYEAFIAINCLDNRSDASPEAQDAQNKRILIATPTLGRFAQNGAEMCAHWPYPVAKRPDSYAAKGSPTIMVIGTTGDPATPYHEAVSLAHDILENGFLVTYNGEGHTAYGRSNECVSSVVDAFLIDGNLPSSEPDC